MARKKTIVEEPVMETPIESTKVENETLEPVQEPAAEVAEPVEEPAAEAEKPAPSVAKPSKEEIPDAARHLLELFSNFEYLYISSKGGVFAPDSKPSASEGAILYKNPYYKH